MSNPPQLSILFPTTPGCRDVQVFVSAGGGESLALKGTWSRTPEPGAASPVRTGATSSVALHRISDGQFGGTFPLPAYDYGKNERSNRNRLRGNTRINLNFHLRFGEDLADEIEFVAGDLQVPRDLTVAYLGDSYGSGCGTGVYDLEPAETRLEGDRYYRSSKAGQWQAIRDFFDGRRAYYASNQTFEGARLTEGVVYDAGQTMPDGWGARPAQMVAALEDIEAATGWPGIDVLVLNIGGNDMDFADLVQFAVQNLGDAFDQPGSTLGDRLRVNLLEKAEHLRRNFDHFFYAFNEYIHPSQVWICSYPDATKNSLKSYEYEALISWGEFYWLANNLLKPLNAIIGQQSRQGAHVVTFEDATLHGISSDDPWFVLPKYSQYINYAIEGDEALKSIVDWHPIVKHINDKIASSYDYKEWFHPSRTGSGKIYRDQVFSSLMTHFQDEVRYRRVKFQTRLYRSGDADGMREPLRPAPLEGKSEQALQALEARWMAANAGALDTGLPDRPWSRPIPRAFFSALKNGTGGKLAGKKGAALKALKAAAETYKPFDVQAALVEAALGGKPGTVAQARARLNQSLAKRQGLDPARRKALVDFMLGLDPRAKTGAKT